MTYVSDESIRERADYVIDLMKLWVPDLVFVADNVAFQHIALNYTQIELFSSLPKFAFAFCGVTYNLSLFSSSLLQNMRGVSLLQPFDQQISSAILLNPLSTKIAFIFDNSEEGINVCSQLQQLVNLGAINSSGLPVELYQCKTLPVFQEVISALNDSRYAVIVEYANIFLSDQNSSVNVPPNIVSNWILSNVPPSFLGPVEMGFVMNVETSLNATCTLTGIIASEYISYGNFVTPSKTRIGNVDVQITVNEQRFSYLTDLSPGNETFNSPNFISRAVFLNPLIRQVRLILLLLFFLTLYKIGKYKEDNDCQLLLWYLLPF